MNAWTIVRGTGSVLLSVFRLPFRAVRMNIEQFKKAGKVHSDNIVYIRALYRDAVQSKKTSASKTSSTGSFEDVMRSRPDGSPSIDELERRFLRQKRFSLATCAAIMALSLYALASGTLLALATLLSSPPLFFMAALSAQLRLWQLRTRRLSAEERGGLRDFIRERHSWFLEVLNPELKRRPGEQS